MEKIKQQTKCQSNKYKAERDKFKENGDTEKKIRKEGNQDMKNNDTKSGVNGKDRHYYDDWHKV